MKEAQTRLGMDPGVPAPSELYGLSARIAALPSAAERIPIFTPATASELTTNRLGGAVLAEGVNTFFCEAGHYTPTTHPGTEPCRRTNVSIPGDPALAVVSWEKPGAALRFQIPQGKGDLSQAAAISLRAAVDPLSKLNAKGKQQAFSIRVTDGAGKTATATTRADEPALRFPVGEVEAGQDVRRHVHRPAAVDDGAHFDVGTARGGPDGHSGGRVGVRPDADRVAVPGRRGVGAASHPARTRSAAMMGPVEYLVVEFPGSQLKGEIVLAHIELTERATIRIIDLLNEEDTRMLTAGGRGAGLRYNLPQYLP